MLNKTADILNCRHKTQYCNHLRAVCLRMTYANPIY